MKWTRSFPVLTAALLAPAALVALAALPVVRRTRTGPSSAHEQAEIAPAALPTKA